MLRLAVVPQRESVLVTVQTRDRNGHCADASDVTDATRYGVNPALGYAAQPANSIGQYPYYDLYRDGEFDAILIENDILGNPTQPGFYNYSQLLGSDDGEVELAPLDPNDGTRTLWMYLGREFMFDSVYFSLATPGVFTSAVLEIQYWNGSAWTAVTGRVDGDRLDTMLGLSDQVSWARSGDWFPKRIENQLVSTEGQRRVIHRSIFWVRVRLSSLVGFTSLPVLSGCWEGFAAAETTPALWTNVIKPGKATILRGTMIRAHNQHLADSLVASRKQPAEISAGTFNFGKGDYVVQIPTYYAHADCVSSDPASLEYRCTGVNKNGTSVTIPIGSTGIIDRPGRYRLRVYGEIPNLDASVFAGESGHQAFVPDPTLVNPADPESQFDPTWSPVLTAMSTSFDVRLKNTSARVEIQRLASGVDSYSIWVEEDGLRVVLENQGVADYARLRVQDAATGAVIIDTAQAGLREGVAGPLVAQAGVLGVDIDAFRYTESSALRKLQDRGQYHITVWVVRGEEAFVSRVEVNFFA